MWQCHYCRTALDADVLRRNRLCPHCGSDLNCCRNCTHHVNSKCIEPNSPWIANPEIQNACPFFEFRKQRIISQPVDSNEILSEADRAKEAFRALFKNP